MQNQLGEEFLRGISQQEMLHGWALRWDRMEPGAGEGLCEGMQRHSRAHRGGLSLPPHLLAKEFAAEREIVKFAGRDVS